MCVHKQNSYNNNTNSLARNEGDPRVPQGTRFRRSGAAASAVCAIRPKHELTFRERIGRWHDVWLPPHRRGRRRRRTVHDNSMRCGYVVVPRVGWLFGRLAGRLFTWLVQAYRSPARMKPGSEACTGYGEVNKNGGEKKINWRCRSVL